MSLFFGSKNKTKSILRKFSLKPSKKLGQNFLVDQKILKKIIKRADLKKNETVVEIGPGLGILTQELAKKAKMIIAIEKDPRLAELLEKVIFKNQTNIKIIKGDALKILKSLTLPKNYKIISNIPFYLTAPLIRQLLEELSPQPKEIYLLIQKELAQKIVASPPKMNLLALSVQLYARPKIIFYVPKKSFWPKPKVDSALIRILPRKKPLLKDQKLKNNFFEILKAGFSHPRKKIVNNLSKMLKLDKEKAKKYLLENKVSPGKRAENINLDQWLILAKNFRKIKTNEKK